MTETQLKSVVGNVDQDMVIEILKLLPTPAELEEAVTWASGDGDVLAKAGHPLTKKVATVVEISALAKRNHRNDKRQIPGSMCSTVISHAVSNKWRPTSLDPATFDFACAGYLS